MAKEPTQLMLPGMKRHLPYTFKNNFCNNNTNLDLENFLDCDKPAILAAAYFRMGMYNEDDGHPELIGFDCPFDDSEIIYACSEDHLRDLIDHVYNHTDYEISGQLPEIIFDSRGRIMRKAQIRIFNDFGCPIDNTYFSDNRYSQNRESLETFWEREHWHFL